MITNLNLKLNGKLPVDIEELFELVSSWGRKDGFTTISQKIRVSKCEPNACYNLSNLDVSQITNISYLFYESLYNGDLSKWNVSNCKDMNCMFVRSSFNNDSLKDWDVSNVENMPYMFYKSKFNGDLSNWNISNVKQMLSIFSTSPFEGDISLWQFNANVDCDDIFNGSFNFINKYNNQKNIPNNSKKFIEWFENNKNKIMEIKNPKEKILEFFSFENYNLENKL